eukprot:TRINITY_DN535_c0_g1_i1.p1 TRINITY_DN535_c0_g1~~TRINITY_DN535_c0_g1_i1.p1  ORF type:complete len:587 (+),score=150.23 TRINITY_DN535_c0_g1_i1:46-1761(+)
MKALLYEKKNGKWNILNDFFVEFQDDLRVMVLRSCVSSSNEDAIKNKKESVFEVDIESTNFTVHQTTTLIFGNFRTGQKILNFDNEQDLSKVLKRILTFEGVLVDEIPECCYSGLEEFHSFIEMIDDSRIAFILVFENDGNLFNRIYSIYTIAKRMGDVKRIQLIIDLIFFFIGTQNYEIFKYLLANFWEKLIDILNHLEKKANFLKDYETLEFIAVLDFPSEITDEITFLNKMMFLRDQVTFARVSDDLISFFDSSVAKSFMNILSNEYFANVNNLKPLIMLNNNDIDIDSIKYRLQFILNIVTCLPLPTFSTMEECRLVVGQFLNRLLDIGILNSFLGYFNEETIDRDVLVLIISILIHMNTIVTNKLNTLINLSNLKKKANNKCDFCMSLIKSLIKINDETCWIVGCQFFIESFQKPLINDNPLEILIINFWLTCFPLIIDHLAKPTNNARTKYYIMSILSIIMECQSFDQIFENIEDIFNLEFLPLLIKLFNSAILSTNENKNHFILIPISKIFNVLLEKQLYLSEIVPLTIKQLKKCNSDLIEGILLSKIVELNLNGVSCEKNGFD